jgi:hypothetical protein
MSYTVELSREALEVIEKLPLTLQRHIALELRRLGQGPAALSKRASSMHPPGQLFEIEYHFEELGWFIDVIFKYEREEVLLVTHVAVEAS